MKKLVFAIFIVSLLFSCRKAESSNKIRIITTIFPLYDFARTIAQDKAEVELLLPPGVEAHSYEPTPRDLVLLNKADLFIYIGEMMEPWAHEILHTVKSKKLIIIEASQGIDLLETNSEEKQDGEHQHKGTDPHIWLDFEIDQKIITKIGAAISQIDPVNKEFYQINVQAYLKSLKNLDERYAQTISKCEIKTILYAGHFAFGYLARRYGLNHLSPYEGFSPNAEPRPLHIKELITNIDKYQAEVIFYEELLETRVARVIAKETGVEIILLHGAHNISKSEMSQGITFFQIMDDNLEKLKKGLKCQ